MRLLANLTARWHVHREVEDALGGSGLAQLLAAQVAFAADYTDSIEWVRGKIAMSRGEFDQLAAAEQEAAFTVAGVTDDVVIGRIQDRVQSAIAEGTDLDTFRGAVDDLLNAAGLNLLNPWHIETVFRTNVHDAYGAGRWAELHRPVIDGLIAGYEYVAVLDDRTRHEHRMMDGRRFSKDSAVWQSWWPPNGFNCRCTTLPIFVTQRKPRLEDSLPAAQPDAGFARSPGLRLAA